MINAKQIIEDAANMGITTEIADGRIRFEGTRGNVKRLFAAQGFDVVAQGETGFAVYAGAPAGFVATICSISPAYAYAYSAK